jgi:membrane associated rhomboid family serine protease
VAGCFFVYAAQSLTGGWGAAVTSWLGLSWGMLARGCVWQPLTAMFCHGGWLHLLLNCVALLYFGWLLEKAVGTGRFLCVFLIGGAAANLLGLGLAALLPRLPPQVTLAYWVPSEVNGVLDEVFHMRIGAAGPGLARMREVGASGAIFAVILAFATLFPRRTVSGWPLLLPFRMKAWVAGGVLSAAALFSAVALQLRIGRFFIGDTIHLSGAVAGIVLALCVGKEGGGRLAGGNGRPEPSGAAPGRHGQDGPTSSGE